MSTADALPPYSNPEAICFACNAHSQPTVQQNHPNLSIDIEYTERGFFLYPPPQQANVITNPDTLVDSHTVLGQVIVTNNTKAPETIIGPVRLAWEVQIIPKEGKREVMARYETDVREDDSIIGPGVTIMPFTLKVPSVLPPYQVTIFDILLHRAFAAILEPVPDYHAPSQPRDSIVTIDSDHSGGASGNASEDEGSTQTGRQSLASLDSGSGPISPNRLNRSPKDKESASKSRSKAIKSFFRRASAATAKGKEKETDYFAQQYGGKRRGSLAPLAPLEANTTQLEFPLPSSLKINMASVHRPAGIVSCPCAKGDVPMLSWVKFSSIGGLGESELDVSSDLCVVGSGVLMGLDLTGLDPRTTIHQIKLVLVQTTRAGQACANPGEEDVTEYTIFSAGPPHLDDLPAIPQPSDYVWRGEIPRAIDAAMDAQRVHRPGSSSNAAPRPQPVPPYADSISDDSIRLSPLCRLPTPIIGAHSTSPVVLDPRLSRTSHSLRYEVIFSVLGEAGPGVPMPFAPNSDRLPEGKKRRFWVDNPIILGSCMITPENVIVPSYTPSAPDSAADPHEEYLRNIAARSEPSSFQIPNTRKIWPEHQSLRERAKVHLEDTAGRCACVFGEEMIRQAVGQKPERQWAGPGGDQPDQGSSGGGKLEQLHDVSVVSAPDV